jgi:TolB-like protein
MEREKKTECMPRSTKTSGQEIVSKGLNINGTHRLLSDPLLRTLCLVFVLMCLFMFAEGIGFAEPTQEAERIVIMPFENFSEDIHAVDSVMPFIRKILEEKGFCVIDDASRDAFLLKERIRTTGCIGREAARKMSQELNVKGIMMGSVNSFYNGLNPVIGLSARLVRASDCSMIWVNNTSFTGEDFTTILELGTIREIEKLRDKALDKLFDTLNIYPPNKKMKSTRKIAVMPLENESKKGDAGMIATYLFLSALFKDGKFEPVEFGEVRRFMVESKLRGKGELDYANKDTLASKTGVDGILVGTVELYNEGSGNTPPEASISARLIDAHSKRILWCNRYEVRGDDDIVILDWGKIRSAEHAVYKVISKIVKDLETVKWQ